MHAFRGHMAHQHALDRQIFDYDLVIVSNQFSRKLLDQVVLDIASLPIACLNANFPGFYNSMSKMPTITAFFEV